jgi:hypothetical protein
LAKGEEAAKAAEGVIKHMAEPYVKKAEQVAERAAADEAKTAGKDAARRAPFNRDDELAKLPKRPGPNEPGPRTTHGRGTYSDGRTHQFSSSNQENKDLIKDSNDRLRDRGLLPGRANSTRASDAEQKFATQMRNDGVDRADLVVNNADGPCTQRLGCDQSLPDLLNPGQELTVHWQDASGVWHQKTYVGR